MLKINVYWCFIDFDFFISRFYVVSWKNLNQKCYLNVSKLKWYKTTKNYFSWAGKPLLVIKLYSHLIALKPAIQREHAVRVIFFLYFVISSSTAPRCGYLPPPSFTPGSRRQVSTPPRFASALPKRLSLLPQALRILTPDNWGNTMAALLPLGLRRWVGLDVWALVPHLQADWGFQKGGQMDRNG